MNLTVNDWDRPEALLAAATFLQALAAIPREGPAVDYPDGQPGTPGNIATPQAVLDKPPLFSVDLATGAATLVRESDTAPATETVEIPPGRVDMKGVGFNADYCSEAKDPFYASGPNAGQWKCKRGVPGATYDHWYANELAAISLSAGAAEPGPVDVSQAFGPATTAAPATAKAAPDNCGGLMVWVSEQQVAGTITQEQVQAAYTRHNLTLPDLLPPNPADVIAARVALIYGDLA